MPTDWTSVALVILNTGLVGVGYLGIKEWKRQFEHQQKVKFLDELMFEIERYGRYRRQTHSLSSVAYIPKYQDLMEKYQLSLDKIEALKKRSEFMNLDARKLLIEGLDTIAKIDNNIYNNIDTGIKKVSEFANENYKILYSKKSFWYFGLK